MSNPEIENYVSTPLNDILHERDRQNQLKKEGKFLATCADDTYTDSEKLAVLAEEFGEVSKEVVEKKIHDMKCPENPLGCTDPTHKIKLRKELIQVAAVCVAWCEALDRNAHESKKVHVDNTPAFKNRPWKK